jgi:aminopeptidase YwaD
LREEEIVFSCHLDHPRPGANDNASGCATILEVGRTLAKLIAEGKIARPARTIRFVWPMEIEGTLVLLNAKPDWAKRIKAVVHMDMVGGGPETKAVFHVTRGPMSLPSFIYDVAEAFGEFVNEQSYQFAATGQAAYPLVATEGGKEPLLARMSEFSMGSDHDVYMDSSWRIPAIYLNDWPDRYIHTNMDVAANIDPTKLKRAAFIGAASGLFLAAAPNANDLERAEKVIAVARIMRSARVLQSTIGIAEPERSALIRAWSDYERETVVSARGYFKAPVSSALMSFSLPFGELQPPQQPSRDGTIIFQRRPHPSGPMSVFGYDYFTDKYGEEKARSLKLLNYQGLRGSGGEYAYEVLNFVDGARNAQQIRDAVSAEYGPVPLEYVVEYLRALESIKVVQRVP